MPTTIKHPERKPKLEILAIFKFEYTGDKKKAMELARSQIVSDVNEYWQAPYEECDLTDLTVRMPIQILNRIEGIKAICKSWMDRPIVNTSINVLDELNPEEIIGDLHTIFSICRNIELEDMDIAENR